jgi:hypothetical protein
MACKYLCDVHNVAANASLRYAIPMTVRHGKTIDISAFLTFRFFERVYYHNPSTSFPQTKEQTGYWLGVAHSIGDALTYYVLNDTTKRVLVRSVVRPYRLYVENK